MAGQGQPQEPATLVLRVEADGAGKVLVARMIAVCGIGSPVGPAKSFPTNAASLKMVYTIPGQQAPWHNISSAVNQ